MAQVYLWIVGQFTGGSYYFAWPFPGMIMQNLKNENFMLEPRYQEITNFLKNHGLTDTA